MNHRKPLASLTARSAAIMAALSPAYSPPVTPPPPDFGPSGSAGVAS